MDGMVVWCCCKDQGSCADLEEGRHATIAVHAVGTANGTAGGVTLPHSIKPAVAEALQPNANLQQEEAKQTESESTTALLPEEAKDQFVGTVQAGDSQLACIDNPGEKAPGLELDLLDGVTALVCEVRVGPVAAWNLAHMGREIKINDRIVEVNSVRGNAHDIESRLKDATLRMIVQRPLEEEISVGKTGCRCSLGVDLAWTNTGSTLLITSVNKGLIEEWNAAHKGLEVTVDDRIVSVNGVSGEASTLMSCIKEQVRGGKVMELKILRKDMPPT
jgi:hypothetical protein